MGKSRHPDTSEPRSPLDETIGEPRPMVIGEPATGIALLILSGAMLGGAIGAALLFVLQLGAPGGIHPSVDVPFSLVLGGGFGAVIGALSAPLLGATLLRRVPYGVAMLGTAAGTVLGATLGIALGSPVKGGLAGYALAAVALFLGYRHRKSAG